MTTKEGAGWVCHMCLVGKNVPDWKQIRIVWTRLTGATMLDIQWVRRKKAWYLEMTRQQKVSRYSSSRGWLWKGARQDWKQICRSQIHYYKDNNNQIKMSWNQKTALRRWSERIREIYLCSIAWEQEQSLIDLGFHWNPPKSLIEPFLQAQSDTGTFVNQSEKTPKKGAW